MRRTWDKMKNRQSLSVYVFVLSAFYISGSNGTATTTLLPQTVEAAENTNVTLTCSYGDQNAGLFQLGRVQWILNQNTVNVENTNCRTPSWLNDSNLYSYRCISNTSHSVTLININQQRHGETWSCAFWDGVRLLSSSNNVSVLVIVPVTFVTVSPSTTVLTEKESKMIDFYCTSSPCRPKPKFRWYKTNSTNPGGSAAIFNESDPIENETNGINSYTSRLNITLNRSWNDWFIFCGANKSIGEFVVSAKIQINVTYPPDGPPKIETFVNGTELNILKNSSVVLTCLITGGNPLPRLEWNKNIQMQQIVSGSTVKRNITWHAVELTKDELRCQSIQFDIIYYTYVSVNVLYPPDEPVIKVKSDGKEYTPVNGMLSVIERQSFTLKCSAASNPPVSSFKWNDLPPSSNPVMDIVNVTRKETTVTCIASNVMQINYPNRSLNGSNKTSFTLDVLYPPTMNKLKDKTVKEGDNLTFSCDFVNGNPGVIEIIWTGMNQTWSGQQLQLKNVSKQQEGLYRCSVHNFMSSWDGIQVVGNVSGEFYLLVQDDANHDSTHNGTSPPLSNASSIVTGAAAGAAGGLFIIVAFVIIVIFYKRRLNNKKQDASGQYVGLKSPKDKIMELNHDVKQSDNPDDHKQSPVLPGRQIITNDDHGLQELDDYDDNIKTDYGIYGNDYSRIKRIERVEVIELFPYLTDKTAEFFAADYAKLPQGLTKSYEFSQKPENIALNRYHGIYPYDHSRVKIPSIPEYFINACYIDGYKKIKAYIASLGPLSKTSNRFVMFWQMVWSEKSDVIVMLTKLTEPSGIKCDQYWPKDGSSETYGEVSVISTGEETFSDYILRKFSIMKGGQNRNLKHFHFMAWPDKSIPEDVTCLLEFRRSVRASHSSGPLIVHCSAGIGRTGTLIAIDMLIDEGQKKGSVNVLECVKKMRDQRVNMVQTLDQYYYIYKTLVNALVFDNDAIPAEKLHRYVETSKLNKFSDMFRTFNLSVESENTLENNSRNANKILKDKNRAGSDIPGDAHRVRLFLNRGMEASDYINAMYLNSYTVADHFITAQSPLPNGVEDFLCLIYQENCCCVVSMDGEQARQSVGSYVPPDNSNFNAGSYNVQCSRLDTKETYIVRKLKIEINGQIKGAEKVVYHFQFLGWLDGNKAPNDPRQFVEFTEDVERFAGQFGAEGSHVLVHCLNAFERSCLFCAVVALIEKIKHEKEVCIPNTLRQIRTRRKLAIPTLEQFKFCYQAADAYVNMEKAGTNNAENSYMNMTMI